MSGRAPLVHIHYLRPPDREKIFTQHLVLDRADVKVSLATNLAIAPPIEIAGRLALEPGSSAVWFTFPGEWHDVGLFYLADGTFTGRYANILTPPTFHEGGVWRTTDLFLDLWQAPGEPLLLLDEDELDEAVEMGWVDDETARRARAEARSLRERAEAGDWPPPVVAEWTLERARAGL